MERELADLMAGVSASKLREDTATRELAALIATQKAEDANLTESALRADNAERALADYKADRLKDDKAPPVSGPSDSLMRAEYAEKALADYKGLHPRPPGSSTRGSQPADMEKKSSFGNTRIRELEAEVANLKIREDRAGLDRLEEIKTVVFKSFQLDLVFLVDSTGSMLRTIHMVSFSHRH